MSRFRGFRGLRGGHQLLHQFVNICAIKAKTTERKLFLASSFKRLWNLLPKVVAIGKRCTVPWVFPL